MRVVALVILALSMIPSNAWSWGPDGHKIVCFIASELLTKTDQSKLLAVIGNFDFEGQSYEFYGSSCVFADRARGGARNYEEAVANGDTEEADKLKPWARFAMFEKWHCLNLERDDAVVDVEDCPQSSGCVLEGIEYHVQKLKTGTPEERAEAAIMLGHWVGDIHQPVHVSFEDDLGGNRIDKISGIYGAEVKFHYVWDSGIIKFAMQRDDIHWLTYARRLLEDIDRSDREAWAEGTPVDWAQESYDITRDPESEYCEQTVTGCNSLGPTRYFGDGYQDINEPKVERRLKQAGVRLARLLDEAL